MALVIVLVCVGVSAWLGYRYAGSLLGKGQRHVNNLVEAGSGQPVNFLLVGSDSRQGLSKAELNRIQTIATPGERTDTIIIVHISPKRHKAIMLSIPRDLRVQLNGHTDKINAAYAGGPDLLVKTVEQVTGLDLNHYVELDFAGFLQVVNAIGGVELCNTTGKTLNDAYANLHMPPGCHQMNGEQALAFVRARHATAGGDFDRIARQQQFLRAVMKKVASGGNLVNIPRTLHIANIVSDHVHTDSTLTTAGALSLARRLGRLSDSDVDMRSLPSYDPGAQCSGCADFVRMSPKAVLLLKAIKDDAAELPPVGVPGKTSSTEPLRITVLNGSGQTGKAARVARTLDATGFFNVVTTGNAAQTGDGSTLAYPPGMEQSARMAATLLGSGVTVAPAAPGTARSGVLVLTVGRSFTVPR